MLLLLGTYLFHTLLNVFLLQQNATSYIEFKNNECQNESENTSTTCTTSLFGFTETPSMSSVRNDIERNSKKSNQGNKQKIEENNKIKEEFSSIIAENFQRFDSEWDPTFRSNNNRSVPNVIMNLYQSMEYRNSKVNLIKCLHVTEFEYITNGIVVKIALNGLQNMEKIVGAELYLYRFSQRFEQASTDSNIVRLYQILSKNETDSQYDKENIDIHELLGVLYVSAYDQGWQVFNVENSLEKLKNGEFNLNFLISVSDTWGNIIDTKQFDLDTTKSPYTPLLVVHFQQLFHVISPSQELPAATPPIKNGLANMCKRHHVYINFSEDPFNNFIIHPEGLMIYKCTGKCQPQLTNITNHAMLLNIFQKLQGTEISENTCVPNKYVPATIVFYDSFGNIVIKKYYNLIVSSCSCR